MSSLSDQGIKLINFGDCTYCGDQHAALYEDGAGQRYMSCQGCGFTTFIPEEQRQPRWWNRINNESIQPVWVVRAAAISACIGVLVGVWWAGH